MGRISTLIAAPRDSALQQLREYLMYRGEIKLLDEGADNDPVRLVRGYKPDVLLLDGGGYGAGTIAMLERMQGIDPGIKTLVFCRVVSEQYVARALAHGASGCLRTGVSAQQVATAISVVHSGELWAARKTLAHAFRRLLTVESPPETNVAQTCLSPREREIVAWMRQGMTNKEIGRQLGISDMTVKTHAHNIFHKMSISGRVRLLQKLRPERLPIHRGRPEELLRLPSRTTRDRVTFSSALSISTSMQTVANIPAKRS